MAITLVATPGASTANTYATVAEADTFLEYSTDWASWDALSDDDKGRYLVNATKDIEAQPLAGEKADTGTTSGLPNQALHFPRAIDNDGTAYIPIAVKLATIEQALFLFQRGSTSATARQRLQEDGVTAASFGDVSETYGGKGSGGVRLSSAAKAFLLDAGLLDITGILYRG